MTSILNALNNIQPNLTVHLNSKKLTAYEALKEAKRFERDLVLKIK